MNRPPRPLSVRPSWLLCVLALLASTYTPVASQVAAWGSNYYGQTNAPSSLTNLVALAAGYGHSLALRAEGTVAAWGYNSVGQANVPPGLSNVRAVATGWLHSLALKADGTLVAWGYPGYGLAIVPAGLGNVVAIGAGAYHNLAVKADGTVAAWGANTGGQTIVPVGLANVVAVAGGLQHSLALKADNTVVAWGNNGYGQATVPPGLANVVGIAAGAYHNLALLANGTVVAWGYNGYGQSTVPLKLTNVTAIACGSYHSLALKGDGTVVAWGYNYDGETRVPAGLMNAAAIAAGDSHSLALLGTPPAITAQPQNLSVTEASSATFSVGASGFPKVHYQWEFNGLAIAGATDSSFTVLNAHLSDGGLYAARVTNPLGSAASVQARLTVNSLIVVRCTDVIVAAGDDCLANASVDNGSFDPNGGPIALTQLPPGPYPLGTNVVTLIATGSQGASNSCTAVVVVLDRTAPMVAPPPDIVMTNDLNQCGAIVAFPQPTAGDRCSAVTNITCTPSSGSFFPVGTTTVQCSATDAAGNAGYASFTVTVYDVQPPTIVCPADTVVTNVHGTWASVISFSPVAEDNCPGLGQPVCSPPSGSAFGVGYHTVNCSVVDAAGNGASCSFHVTVWPGNQPPVPAIELSPLVQLPGCTNFTVIAPDGRNATVTLDGSKSFDPDDPVFEYAWFNGTQLVSTDKVAVLSLPLGVHGITLILDDALPAGRSRASMQVEVLSPAQAVGLLGPLVESSALMPSAQRPLLSTLDAAISSIERGNLIAGLNQLNAFQNKAQAQIAKSNRALAEALIQSAQEIVDALTTYAQATPPAVGKH